MMNKYFREHTGELILTDSLPFASGQEGEVFRTARHGLQAVLSPHKGASRQTRRHAAVCTPRSLPASIGLAKCRDS